MQNLPTLRRAFTIGFLVSIALLAAIGISVLLLPGLQFEDEILFTCLLATGFNFVAAAIASFISKPHLRWLAWIGLPSVVLSTLLCVIIIWMPRDMFSWTAGEIIARAAGVTAILAVWPMLSGVFLMLKLPPLWVQRVRIASLIALGIFAVQVLWIAIHENSFDSFIKETLGWDLAERFNGVNGILLGTGITVMIVMAILGRRTAAEANESVTRRALVHLNCPRCGTEQDLSAGHARCTDCGLRISIEVEEPRCYCGYLLHELKSETCPECGRAIPIQDQVAWAGSQAFSKDASTQSG